MSTGKLTALRRRLDSDGGGALARRIFGSGLSAVMVKVAAAGLSYLMFVVLAKVMNESEYGMFAFSFNFGIIVATVAGVGATTAIMRFWPQYEVNGQPDLAHGSLRAGAMATAMASALCGIAVIAAAPAIAAAASFADTTPIIMVGFFGPAVALSEYAAAALRAKGVVFWSLAPRDVFWRAGVPAAAAALAWSTGSIGATAALFLATGLLFAITALQGLYALRVFGLAQVVRTDWPAWRKASTAMWGAAVLYALVQQCDVVIAGLFLPPAETGSYFAAQKTATLLSLLMIAGNLISAPLISAHYHAEDRSGLQRLCSLLALGIAVPTLIGFALMALVGNGLLSIFDPTFVSAYPVLIILAAAAAFDAMAGPTGYFLQMSGRETAYLKIMAATYAGVLVLQLMLAPRFGAIGIAVPTAIGVIVWNALAVMLLRRQTGVDPSIFGVARLFRAGDSPKVS